MKRKATKVEAEINTRMATPEGEGSLGTPRSSSGTAAMAPLVARV